ncbi:MAG: hypothetical protein WBV06_16440 [Acidimicrobiia bacterium]
MNPHDLPRGGGLHDGFKVLRAVPTGEQEATEDPVMRREVTLSDVDSCLGVDRVVPRLIVTQVPGDRRSYL